MSSQINDRDRRHAAWIKARLLSDWGKSALSTNAEAAMRRILETEVRQLFDAASLSAFIDKVSGDPMLSDTIDRVSVRRCCCRWRACAKTLTNWRLRL